MTAVAHPIRLEAVTLTGLDEATSLDEVLELAAAHPFVEWGVLYSPKRSGQDPRYPSVGTALAFLQALGEAGVRTAVHVCGQGVERLLMGQDPGAAALVALAGRVQLNFNQARAPVDLAMVDALANALARPVITQGNQANVEVAGQLTSVFHQVLFDASGGLGQAPAQWPERLSGKVCGWAGGLGPSTLGNALPDIEGRAGEHPYWVDMETSLRDERDLLVLDRCAQVLATASRWRGG